ncbi:MAG: DUF5060 domain-containing protein, partial [Planctomycetes bacterium]|nr:DUF5060 domain-containing protein [Planctomycetota bacterium]
MPKVSAFLLVIGMETLLMAAPREKLEQMGLVSRQALKLGEVKANATSTPRGRKFELTFSLDATFDNPFDPDDIDVSCQFTTPSGKTLTVPAFFCTPFTRQADGSVGQGGKSAAGGWQVRFAPMEVGVHRYRITVRDRNGRVESALGEMTCVTADNDGFIRVSSAQPYALEFESGKPYLPLGFNLFINTSLGRPIPADRLARCEKFMNRLADWGGNFVRLRMDSWWNAIEMTPDEAAGYLGLGWYHQQTCWEIDQLYELAEQRGLYVMHCLDNANSSVNDPPRKGRDAWRRRYNLYLKENGGPCAKAEDFWTDATTAKFVRRKLRYCLARWGYSRNLMCWEFWNEVLCRPETVAASAKWHQDMARYLRANDPYRHPVSTSIMGDEALFDRFGQLPEMEIAQVHVYRQPDIAAAMAAILDRAAKQWRKPFFFGEFGIGPIEGKEGGYDFDGQGVHLHNGLWAPVVGGAAGAGAFWYIEGYLDKLNLWPRFRPLADWARDVPWNAPDLKPLQVKHLGFA